MDENNAWTSKLSVGVVLIVFSAIASLSMMLLSENNTRLIRLEREVDDVHTSTRVIDERLSKLPPQDLMYRLGRLESDVQELQQRHK